ncbi:hypothetical protein LXA43DRAFT_1101179 [Ganoderma leucocontextum]|nr:hypothetical protein LXA43DRAFT_1101179 [Ganoderma leucocontextum]
MVSGFSGAAQKAFYGLANARAAWERGPMRNGGWRPPRPQVARPTPNRHRVTGLPEDRDDKDDNEGISNDLEFTTRAPPIRVCISREDLCYINCSREGNGADDYESDSVQITPSPSPVSSASILSTPSWMSSGTLTPRTVATPQLTPSMASLSLRERFTDANSVVMHALAGSSSASTTYYSAHSSPGTRPYILTPMHVNPHLSSRRSSGARGVLGSDHAVRRAKGDPVWVVVRGERPGVYLKYNTAVLAAGFNPVLKMVRFASLKYSCLYFVQQYMSGNVGVPIFVEEEEEEDFQEA